MFDIACLAHEVVMSHLDASVFRTEIKDLTSPPPDRD